jgi:hypothetical protein
MLIGQLPTYLAEHLRANHDLLTGATLLNVICGRLSHWTVPGLLLIGDAAHPKQIPDCCFVFDGHVEIAARNADVGMARSVANLGQRPSAGQGVADKGVSAVMDGQRLEPCGRR